MFKAIFLDFYGTVVHKDVKKDYENYSEIHKLFKEHNGLINSASLREKGISYYQLNKLEEIGIITKVKRGLYALSDIKKTLHEMVEAALYVPKGVICLYSALAHHELSTFTPSEYNFAISGKEAVTSDLSTNSFALL